MNDQTLQLYLDGIIQRLDTMITLMEEPEDENTPENTTLNIRQKD